MEDEYLKQVAENLEKNPPEDTNGGYEALMVDLEILFDEAKNYEFDDFRNTKYPAPKMTLINRLQELIANTQDGKYDN